jgi:hypothetical protein
LESTVACSPTTRIHLEQGDRRCRALEIDFLQDPGGGASESTLRPTLSAVVGSTFFSTTSFKPKLVGPELFVAKGLEAEQALALRNEGG